MTESSGPVASGLSGGLMAGLLALVTGAQALATFAVLAMPTLATLAAPHYGIGPETIGYQISLVYAAAAVVSCFAGVFVRRWGAALTSASAMALAGLGLLAIAAGQVALAVAGSLVIGFAYSLTNPAASHMLFRFAPRKRQNLVFALKQTGVPLGGMLAALTLPRLAAELGWQWAIASGAILVAVVAGPMLALRSRLDDDRNPQARLGAGGILSGVRLVLATPSLRALALMGFAYSSSQLCLFAFLITMLVKELGWGLVEAGGIASVMQISGVIGRIAWSVLADWIGRGVGVLVAIGLASAGFAVGLANATPDWPAWLLTGLIACYGFCIVGWNGLWMAEVARAAGPGEVSLATGAVLVFAFGGIVIGPTMFTAVYKWIGSYALTFGVFSVYAAAGALYLMMAGRRAAAS